MSRLADAIRFSKPYRVGAELENLSRVLDSDHIHGDGPFTYSASERLREISGGGAVLLTASGTDALEMTGRLLDLVPGDEVILPTFTFPSAANAVAMQGATCVFVDIDPRTGNIDPAQVAEAIGPRTRAVSVMHYGGVPVDLDTIIDLTRPLGIAVIEDNAHGLGVQTAQGVLGSRGVMAIQSFHDTKNIQSGEGGALLVSDPALVERAEIIREKGTDRSRFLRGQVDKYSWVDIGSSYLMSELNAAVLDAQLGSFDLIQSLRHTIWNRYSNELGPWAADRGFRLMDPPDGIHAAHVFYLIAPDHEAREGMLRLLRARDIEATSHYVPLDSSIAGRRYGRTLRPLTTAEDFSLRIVRLPLWPAMTEDAVTRVIDAVRSYATTGASREVAR